MRKNCILCGYAVKARHKNYCNKCTRSRKSTEHMRLLKLLEPPIPENELCRCCRTRRGAKHATRPYCTTCYHNGDARIHRKKTARPRQLFDTGMVINETTNKIHKPDGSTMPIPDDLIWQYFFEEHRAQCNILKIMSTQKLVVN